MTGRGAANDDVFAVVVDDHLWRTPPAAVSSDLDCSAPAADVDPTCEQWPTPDRFPCHANFCPCNPEKKHFFLKIYTFVYLLEVKLNKFLKNLQSENKKSFIPKKYAPYFCTFFEPKNILYI